MARDGPSIEWGVFMHKRAIILGLLLGVAGLSTADEVKTFGKPLQGLPSASLEQVLAKPQAGASVRIEGTIEKACQEKGCWIEVRQGSQAVHVTFEGYSFFVPKDSAGKAVVLEGKVVVKEPDPEHSAHLKAEGAGASALSKVSIEATGIEISAAAK
jgi:hypothetical protein